MVKINMTISREGTEVTTEPNDIAPDSAIIFAAFNMVGAKLFRFIDTQTTLDPDTLWGVPALNIEDIELTVTIKANTPKNNASSRDSELAKYKKPMLADWPDYGLCIDYEEGELETYQGMVLTYKDKPFAKSNTGNVAKDFLKVTETLKDGQAVALLSCFWNWHLDGGELPDEIIQWGNGKMTTSRVRKALTKALAAE